MNILVTGGAGFIGSHLVDKLVNKCHRVVVIDNLTSGKAENLNSKVEFYNFNVQDEKVIEVFEKEKLEVIFHLAAQIDVRKSVEHPVSDATTNILGSLNLLENAKKYRVKKFIFASTGGAIYGDANIIPTPETYPEFPLSPYGICKLTIEKFLNYYFEVFALPFVSLRYANVYGPRQNSKGEAGVVAIFCEKMLIGKQPIINGNGKQTRDFVFVEDVIEANILAMNENRIGVFNIGTAKETSVNEIFEKLRNLIKSECKKICVPPKEGEQKRSCLSIEKAKKELNWQLQYKLDESLGKTVEWFTHFNSRNKK